MTAAVRPAKLADVPALCLLEAACFAPPWSEASVREAVEGARSFAFVAEVEGALVGFGAAWTLLEEGEITRVAVRPAARGQGIGAALMRALLHECAARGAGMVFLEVRAGNASARRLYETLGFAACGTRRAYYPNGEDALVMCLQLGEPG